MGRKSGGKPLKNYNCQNFIGRLELLVIDDKMTSNIISNSKTLELNENKQKKKRIK